MEALVLTLAVVIVAVLVGIAYAGAVHRGWRLTYARWALLSGIGSLVFHCSAWGSAYVRMCEGLPASFIAPSWVGACLSGFAAGIVACCLGIASLQKEGVKPEAVIGIIVGISFTFYNGFVLLASAIGHGLLT